MQKTELAIININEIEHGERYREDLGEIGDLARSLKDRGIIQPLAVMRSDNGGYLLLAGGRRYAACKHAEITEIPVRIYPADLSEYEIRAIELAENFHRKDLTWTEQIQLQRKVHTLYQEIYGVRSKSESDGWSTQDTSELLGKSRSSVKQDLALAEAYSQAPELFEKCKNKSDATKVLDHVKANMIQQELQKRAASQVKSDPEKTKLINNYIVGDMFKLAPQIPNGSIDLIEFDPPYGIDLKNAKRTSDTTEVTDEYNEVDAKDYPTFIQQALNECYRVMAPNSWLILWFGPEPWYQTVYNAILNAGKPAEVPLEDWIKSKRGLFTSRITGVWNKEYGQTKRPEHNLANAHEDFFVVRKGRPALNKPGRSNVFTFKPAPAQQKYHPTERPIELMMELLNTFAPPSSRVWVPCLGSGVTLIAAYQLGMSAFGYELSEEHKKNFTVRVQQTV